MKISPRFLVISFFNLLIFSVPLYFRFENEELFEFNKMILVYGLTICIGFFWLVRMIFEKRLIWKKTPLDYPILFFVFSQFVSTILSIHPYTSWFGYYSRFNGGFLSTISYVVLFYAFVSNFKKSDIGSFLLSAFVSGLLVSMYGILEHFGHSFSCLLISGNKSFGVDCWVQDVQSRVYASFGQPNWLAAYVITLFPVTVVAASQKTLPVFKRTLFTLTSLALFLVLIYTRSRSGMLGLAGSAFVFAIGSSILYFQDKKSVLSKLHLPTVLGITLGILTIALTTGTSFTPSISELFTRSKQTQITDDTQETTNLSSAPVVDRLEGGGTDSGEIRKIVWTGALKVWQRYPFIGSGVETFAYSYYQDRIREHNDVSEWDFLYNKAHNEILNLLATTGIVGLISYLSIFAFFTGITLKVIFSKTHTRTEQLIVVALFSGQVALFISNFFGFSTVGVNVLMYCSFAITCLIFANEKDLSKDIKNNKRTKYELNEATQYFGITLGAILTLFLLFKVYNYWAADKAYSEGKNYFNAGQYQYGIQKQLEAISRSPKEALYFDTLSDNYAKLAAHFATSNEATTAAQLADESVLASNEALNLNARHLNFYKTRARVMVTLSQIDETYLEEAKTTLAQGIQLSPTDPKLIHTLAVIEQTDGNLDSALELYSKVIELKPDYERPYWQMSEIYETQGKYKEAINSLNYILEHISVGNEEALKKKSLLEAKLNTVKK